MSRIYSGNYVIITEANKHLQSYGSVYKVRFSRHDSSDLTIIHGTGPKSPTVSNHRLKTITYDEVEQMKKAQEDKVNSVDKDVWFTVIGGTMGILTTKAKAESFAGQARMKDPDVEIFVCKQMVKVGAPIFNFVGETL